MDKDIWIAVKKYYAQIPEMSEVQQNELLARLEKDEPEVAEILKSLIKDEGETQSDLESPAISKIRDTEKPTDLIGQIIGKYKLTYLIGIGGMGKVYLADRMDLEAHQQVAIKIISAGFLTEIYQKRFDRERKILSRLNHPHITRIYDGGISESGLPYIIMEYVQGMPLMEHVTENNLDLNQRLELFLDLCDAVNYAHRNFVMHRDLKPGNILVTKHGIVKVIDFGIAKILEDEDSEEDLTIMGYIPLTPAYASPEQLKGQPLTMVSDIYSLGVILYELVTGNKPFPGSTKSNLALTERINYKEEAIRPSARINPSLTSDIKEWRRKLKGDIDNIVLKALKENPDERYSSAEQLSDDIKRYQNNYPVLARPESLAYRFRKYAKRNQSLVIVGVLLVLILISGISATLWQAERVAEQRDQAEYEAQKAQQVTQFLTELFDYSDPDQAKGDVITSQNMLALGSEKLSDLDGQPLLQAEMYRVIGNLYRKQNSFPEAEAHLLRALELYKQELGAEDTEVASTQLLLAELYAFQNRTAETIEMSSKAANIFESEKGTQSVNYIKAQSYRARGELQQGNYNEALSQLLTAAEQSKSWRGKIADQSLALTSLYNDIATAYNGLGDQENYVLYIKKALSVALESTGEQNQNVAALYNNLGHSFYFQNEFDSAEYYSIKALRIANELYGNKPNDRSQFAHCNLAKAYIELNENDEAVHHAEQCYEMARDVYGEEHVATGRGLSVLGDVYIAKGDYEKSEDYREKSIRIYESFYEGEAPMLAWLYWDEAERYHNSGNLRMAINYKRKCIDMYEKVLPEELTDLAEARYILAGFLLEADSSRESLPLLEKSLAYYKEEYGEEDENTKAVREDLVRAYNLSNQPDKASALLEGREIN
jgi:serine/threonine-protein kinase